MAKNNGIIWAWLYKMASPKSFYTLSIKWQRVFTIIAFFAFSYGLVGGLYLAPADYQQGDAFRIIYIHVPCAFLSLSVYTLMSFCALLSLVWRIKLADVVLGVSAPLGLTFALLALITGSLWGKPMWGTWWIWDARLTSEFILAFIYIAVIVLKNALGDRPHATTAVAIFTIVGFVDIPLIHYSVNWWNTLHQGATLSQFAKPSIAPAMLYPLLTMLLAFASFFIATLMARSRYEILRQEQRTRWVAKLLAE